MGVVCGTWWGKINTYSLLVGKLERDHLGDLNVDGKIILKLP
jgi:hypothetical protein